MIPRSDVESLVRRGRLVMPFTFGREPLGVAVLLRRCRDHRPGTCPACGAPLSRYGCRIASDLRLPPRCARRGIARILAADCRGPLVALREARAAWRAAHGRTAP